MSDPMRRPVTMRFILLTLAIIIDTAAVDHAAEYPESADNLAQRQKRQISRDQYMKYLQNVNRPNWDPRAEEDWWVLYPYGKWVLDDQLMGQAGRETQTNFAFDFPYFGYRFNYTFVYPMGFVSFGRPPFTMPPFTWPNPLWPMQRDHSFIAPFYADAQYQWIGNQRISNVWFRSVHRPQLDDNQFFNPYDPYRTPSGSDDSRESDRNFGLGGGDENQPQFSNLNPQEARRRKRQMPGRLNQVGMVVDPELLDNITHDVQAGIIGANGWRAAHAFIVTWERMAYGGAPKAVDVSEFEQVKQWQNTFQLVLTTDEVGRSYAIFNYARLNWTTSNEAGGLNGFGGKQAALAGFNGGNGTGYYSLPYSGHGRIWKLGYFSNVMNPGRWIHRVDEVIIPGGCSNGSTGFMEISPPVGPMQGGVAINVSGPCLRRGDFVKVVFENWPVDCRRINRIRAQCIMPMFHKTGLVPIRMSRDGGQSFPFIGHFYVLQPFRGGAKVKLTDSAVNPLNRWYQPNPDTLQMQWQFLNLTYDINARVDINLYGYWEDADRSHFDKIDSIARGIPNNGKYTFRPQSLVRNPLKTDAWKKYHFGFVQVAVSHTDPKGHGVLWSKPTPFAWYHLPYWNQHYGKNWATEMCIEWFEFDGRRRNFIMDLTHAYPCPCRLEQALLDLGRFMPFFKCDMDGDASCPFNKGAQHCIQSVQASWTGASQHCCYDYQGFLMFSDDWEPTGDYLRFFNPGTPVRSHAFGSNPYKRPPRIPGMSHYQLDLLPYRTCCNYAQHCEFYYWRRTTNGCQDYKPPGTAYIYGQSHMFTFDGIRYTFPGKGYYVLLMSNDPYHKLMVQIRLEQPSDSQWRQHVNSTVVTGIVIQENNSDIVEIFARKPLRRWRYKTDIYVNGIRRFFDKPLWKIQQFNGVQIRNPKRNMNHSELIVMMNSGAGFRIQESYGMLDIAVFLPMSFNSSCSLQGRSGENVDKANLYGRPCYVTKGLLGAYNGDKSDDLMLYDGTVVAVPQNTHSASTTETIYNNFGKQWKVPTLRDKVGPVLFQAKHKPIYNPLLFAAKQYTPSFGAEYVPMNATLIFTMEEVDILCAGNPQCKYDYLLTGRREVAANTLSMHKRFVQSKLAGTKLLLSCGPLLKKPGVIKTPPAQNYLDGDVVTFSCKPDWYLHGDAVRRCVNGTWSPGWWVWCRDRYLEYALKWVTGLLVVLAVLIIIISIFCCCWRRRVEKQKGQVYRTGELKTEFQPSKKETVETKYEKPNINQLGFEYDTEPVRVGGNDSYKHSTITTDSEE